MTKESDDPDDVFCGEVPVEYIYDGIQRSYLKKLRTETDSFNKLLKTKGTDIDRATLKLYNDKVDLYTNLILLARTAAAYGIIAKDNYVRKTFDICEKALNEGVDFEQINYDLNIRIGIIECKYQKIIVKNKEISNEQEEDIKRK